MNKKWYLKMKLDINTSYQTFYYFKNNNKDERNYIFGPISKVPKKLKDKPPLDKIDLDRIIFRFGFGRVEKLPLRNVTLIEVQ